MSGEIEMIKSKARESSMRIVERIVKMMTIVGG
jgi:hypothetical protein